MVKKSALLTFAAALAMLATAPSAFAQDSANETLFLVNDATQEVIEVSQAGKIEPVADPLELQALEEKLQLATRNQQADQEADLRGLGIGIGLGRGGIGGGIRIGPIGGGIRIGRSGIRVGGHAGRAGAGARVGRRGVGAGGHIGRSGAGARVGRDGIRAGGRLPTGRRSSFWSAGQWEDGKFNKEEGRFSGQWTPLAVGI